MNNKFITMCFILFAVFTVTVFAFSLQIQATEKKDEIYPNFLLHNATAACMRGIAQLMIQLNPQLRNQYIPPAIQQQILGHCSCIVDKIRVDFILEEYTKKMNDYLWIKKIWGDYGVQCMKAGYLAGVIPDDLPEKLEKVQTDNKTKEDTKVEDNKTKSKKEEILIKEPEPAIFQG